MLYREIIAVCSEIHTKHIKTLCGQKVELLVLNVTQLQPVTVDLLDSCVQSSKHNALWTARMSIRVLFSVWHLSAIKLMPHIAPDFMFSMCWRHVSRKVRVSPTYYYGPAVPEVRHRKC